MEPYLAEIEQFVRNEIYPAEANLLADDLPAVFEWLEQVRQQVKARGWWAPHFHVEYGGMGLSLTEFARVSEILGMSPLGHIAFNCQAPDVGNMEILHQYGTPEQQARWLVPLVNGDIHSCFSMTEPMHAGSNPVMMSTTAVKEGDSYIIDGHKWFTTAADGATFAIVMAITDQYEDNPYARASQIIVPTDADGFNHVRRIKIMGEEAESWFSHSEIKYEGCRVPQSNLLGGEGAGFAIAQQRLGPGRIHHCMRWIGICERALDLMCQRAASRQIAPNVPLGSKQTIQNWIAESRASINAARLLVLDAAQKIDAHGSKAARVEISTIKFFVADVLQTVLDRAIQTHGALGVTDETVLSFWYRHERGARIYDGPDEVHKSVVARQMLRSYGVKISR